MSVASGLILLLQFGAIFSALPQINKCSLSDSDCIKASAQSAIPAFVAGIPDLGTEVLDPMHVDQIKVDLSGLKLNIKDATIKGLKNTVIEKLSVDMAKKHMKLTFYADFTLRAKYKASGKLLILPISGDGDTVMKIKKCTILMDLPFEVKKNKDGKDSIALKSYKYEFDVKDGADYKLTNLFNGNKGLSDGIHAFMNGSWKLMTMEFGRPVFDQPIEKIFNTIKTYLSSQSLEEIANV